MSPARVVVGAPIGEPYDAMLASLTSWSASNLIKPFIWCTLGERIFRSVDTGVVSEGRLADLLDFEHGEVVFVGVLSWPGHLDPSVVKSFDSQMNETERLIQDVVDQQGGAIADQQLLLLPQHLGSTTDPCAVRLDRRTLMLAVEDRANPNGPNALAEDQDATVAEAADRFRAHAASGIAAMLGLWADQTDDVAPLLNEDPFAGNDPVSVKLCSSYTRIADLGYVADNVVTRVMDRSEGWPNPDQSVFDDLETDPELSAKLTGLYLKAHAETLGMSVFDPILPEDKRVSIWTAWLRFWHHIWDSLLFKIRAKIEGFYRDTYEKLRKVTERITGESVVGWEDDIQPLTVAEDQLVERFRPPDGPVRETWYHLRQLCVGMLDGSTVPSFVPESLVLSGSGRRVLLLDPRGYVPSPHDQPPIAGCRPCDPRSLDPRCMRDIELDEQTHQLLEEYAAPRRDAVVWRVGVSISDAIRSAETEAAQAKKKVEQAQEEEAKEREAGHPAERQLRRKVRRLIIAALVLAIAAIAGFVAAFIFLAHLVAIVIGLASIPIWFMLVAIFAIRSYRARKRLQDDAENRMLQRINAAMLAGLRSSDVERLARRYVEYLDWAEALSWWLHEPWTPEPLPAEPIPDRSVLGLPRAAQRRIARISPTSLETMVATGSKSVFPVKWLDGLVDRTVDDAQTAFLRIEQGVFDAAAQGIIPPDPFGDTRTSPRSPRSYVLRMTRELDNRIGRGRQAVTEIERGVGALALLPLVDDVVEDGQADGLQTPTPGWSSAPEDLQRVAQQLTPSVVRIFCGEGGGSGVILDPSQLIITNAHVVDFSPDSTVLVQLADEYEPREAKVVAVSTTTDLASVRLVDSPPSLVGVEVAPQSPSQGAPVVSLGFPKLLDGDPTLAWGLIAARHRTITLEGQNDQPWTFRVLQCTYPAARGASGSGLFDRQGRLVGITCARRLREDEEEAYMTFAVPIEDVQEFLKDGGTVVARPPVALTPTREHDVTGTDLQVFVSAISATEGDGMFLVDHLRDATVDCVADLVHGREALDLADVKIEARAHQPSILLRTVTALSNAIDCADLAQP